MMSPAEWEAFVGAANALLGVVLIAWGVWMVVGVVKYMRHSDRVARMVQSESAAVPDEEARP